jgi:hypothetical protein
VATTLVCTPASDHEPTGLATNTVRTVRAPAVPHSGHGRGSGSSTAQPSPMARSAQRSTNFQL